MRRTKWVVVAGLALALPVMTVVSGCSGGGGGGGVNIPGLGNSPFAGAQANGQLLDGNGQPVGTVAFQVANNGSITGTLTAPIIAGNAIRANKPRATATNGTGTVNNDGTFTLTFDVRSTGNVNGIVTLTGRLVQNGAVVSATDLVFDSPFAGFAGTYTLNITVTVPNNPGGGGGNAVGNFTFGPGAATNANLAAFNPTQVTPLVIRNNGGQVTQLTLTFSDPTSNPLRTATVTIGTGLTVIAPGNFAPGNGAAVSYTETNTGTQQTRIWSSDNLGNVRLDSLTATQAQVTLQNVTLKASVLPGAASPATGSFTISGSGSATIQ